MDNYSKSVLFLKQQRKEFISVFFFIYLQYKMATASEKARSVLV
jgi:hypothetical protein